MSELLANPKICGSCDKPGCVFKCACKLVFYCGEECQRAHWPLHKKDCRLALAKKVKDAKREHGREDKAVAKARIEAGRAHQDQGWYREAEQCFLEARRIYLEIYGEPEEHSDYALLLFYLGQLYSEMKRYDEALSKRLEYLDITRRFAGERSEIVGMALSSIGTTLHDQGKHEQALARLDEAQSILTETSGAEHSQMSTIISTKGSCFGATGRLDEARAMHEEALRIRRTGNGNDSHEVAASLNNLGCIFFETGMLAEARANYEEALAIARRVHGERHPKVATAFSNIAHVLCKQGQLDESLEMHKKALKIKRRALGKNHQDVASQLFTLGDVLALQGKYDEAVEMCDKALAIYTRALGIDNLENARVHCEIALAKQCSGDRAGALESARESVRIFNKHGVNDTESQEALSRALGVLRSLEGGE